MADVTIHDVAKQAGVSISTVSLVINSPGRVKTETRERVLAVIAALGFVPKAEAAAKARKGTGRIGVMAPFTRYQSFEQRLHGAIEALRNQPYEIVIYDQESAALRHDYLASLPISRRLDGLIVMALPFDDHVAASLVQNGLETVLVEFARPGFSSVEIDNNAGGRMAAAYLLTHGHRRCAFLGEQRLSGFVALQSEQRLSGYKAALSEVGVELPAEYVTLAPYGVDEARQQTLRLLDLPQPPSAIFAHSDFQAVGVLKAARSRGLRVPDDLAVIGFDDLDLADYLELTTVRQPLRESGRVAVELLLGRIADRTRPVQRVQLSLSIVARSTA